MRALWNGPISFTGILSLLNTSMNIMPVKLPYSTNTLVTSKLEPITLITMRSS